MSTIINTYPVFESSQVLTSSQLNQVVSYLDQQGRLTRTRLIGMGIVCGLELSYDHSDGDHQVTISKGTAVTSEGYLIKLGKCETSWYRPYQLPEGVAYTPFDNTDPAITLFELLREKPEDDSDVISLNSDPGFLDDKFVLLFLETYDNDIKPCLGNTCDELGIDRIFTVRKLLISKDNLDELLEHSANVGSLYPKKFELPEIVMPRTLFDPEEDHSREVFAFTDHHTSAIQPVFTSLFGEKNGDGARIQGALHQTYSVYDLLLGTEYGLQNPFGIAEINGVIDDFESYLADASDSGTNTPGIQYFSDFMKDLILAYDEFRETAFELVSECCSDMSRFPKHVMLGRAATEHETPEEAVTYRHGFVQPPIYNHQKYLMEKAVSLHKRLVLMVESFSLDLIQNPNPDGEEANPLRITPSDEKNTALSRRSIPFYYNIKSEGQFTGDETLEQHWNFDFVRRTGPGENVIALSYHNQAEDQSEILSPTQTPLYYDLDSYPFLRIEGHIGHDYDEMIDLINSMKSDFDLPFDTLALQLDTDASLLELDYSCGFEDLQEEYSTARKTYCGFIRDLTVLFEFTLEHEGTLFDDSQETSEDLENVNEILESLGKLCELMPECLNDFDFAAFQQSYKTALQLILDFVLVEKELLDEINVDPEDAEEELPVINGMIQRLSPVLFRFVDLLFYNTFLRVYYGFTRRTYYLQREKSVFSNYIRSYTGVQHQAGVPKGGTFIIVYKNDEEKAVIADFNLPYLCCESGRCVPICVDEDSDFVFEIPPFARPDYAITTIGIPVEIDVSLNDYGFRDDEYVVRTSEESENGGFIEMITEQGLLRYTPGKEFTGFDTFQYSIGDPDTGTEDRGTVTVLVKGREVEAGCYSTEILSCWGIELVQEALENRDINTSDMSQQQMIERLLQSLRVTAGFTQDEIRFNILEDGERRRQLLNCIGIEINDNTTYQELERLIVAYQNEHCGEVDPPTGECYSPAILECWGIQSVQFALRTREIDASDMSADQMIDALLESLRETGGFTQNEIRFNVLESEQSRRQLLTCLGINHTPNTTYPELEQLILAYQRENCGGEIIRDDVPRIELSENEIAGRELITVLNARGREMGEDAPLSDLRNEISRTSPGMQFSKAEVMLFTRDRIIDILRSRGLNAPSSANKSQLTDILFGE